MNINLKKFTAMAVAAGMIASVSGCAAFDKDDDAVLAVADEYATAVAGIKTSKILKLTADPDSDFEDNIESFVDHSADTWGEDYDKIVSAIESTITYTIDAESVESSKKDEEASVDVVYTIVDYDAVYDQVTEDGGDVDAFVEALGSSEEVTEIEQTIDFVYDDKEWLVDDEDGDLVFEVYSFYTDAFELEFVPALSADLVDYLDWYTSYEEDGSYDNTYDIELDIIPTEEGQEVDWVFYYEVKKDGELIYTSDEMEDYGYFIEAYYGVDYDGATEEDGYLAAGDYTITFFTMDGEEIASSTSTVRVDVDTSSSSSGEVTADSFAEGVETYWYSYSDGSGYSMENGEYTTEESIIEFTCYVVDEELLSTYPVYYEVWYSATGSTDDAESVYTGTVTPSEYSNGFFYEFQYVADSTLEAGTYYIVGADSTGTTVFFTETATVS